MNIECEQKWCNRVNWIAPGLGLKKMWLHGYVAVCTCGQLHLSCFQQGQSLGTGAGHLLVAVRGRSCQGCAQGEEEQMGIQQKNQTTELNFPALCPKSHLKASLFCTFSGFLKIFLWRATAMAPYLFPVLQEEEGPQFLPWKLVKSQLDKSLMSHAWFTQQNWLFGH